MMTKAELLEKYKGGFTFGEDWETYEILINEKETKDNCLCLWVYDANMMPALNISKWPKQAREKLVKRLKKCLTNLNADVWIDDLQIKERL